MSLASALGGLMGKRDRYITGNYGPQNVPETITIGDMSKEELLKAIGNQIDQRRGYPLECKFLEKFLSDLTISEHQQKINLQKMGASDGNDDWYWIWSGDTNHMAKARGLKYCTPEIVCKLFLHFREKLRVENKEGTVHVSCGELICTLSSRASSYEYSNRLEGYTLKWSRLSTQLLWITALAQFDF